MHSFSVKILDMERLTPVIASGAKFSLGRNYTCYEKNLGYSLYSPRGEMQTTHFTPGQNSKNHFESVSGVFHIS